MFIPHFQPFQGSHGMHIQFQKLILIMYLHANAKIIQSVHIDIGHTLY